jgi:hypothetical protein
VGSPWPSDVVSRLSPLAAVKCAAPTPDPVSRLTVNC